MRLRSAIPVLLLALAMTPWAASGGEPVKVAAIGQPDRLIHETLSVDESGVRIEREGPGARVTVPVLSSGLATLDASLSARLVTLEDQTLAGPASASVDLPPGPTEAQVLLPAIEDWNWDHPEGLLIHWSISVGTEGVVLEGRKALGTSRQDLRLLVSLPPRIVAGAPTPFQATITRADGTAAAGASFRIRSGWFGGMQGAFAPEAPSDPALFDGVADGLGVVSGEFTQTGGALAAWYTFTAQHDGGRAVISEPLTFEEDSDGDGRLILTTDKPVYQPSQDVHVRALAFRPGDGRPATGESLMHVVRDPKGTLVFREDLEVDRFGVTHFTFPLADELLLGDYTIEVAGTELSGRIAFAVDRYALPRFSPRVELDHPYVSPGGTLRGRVDLAYVFGAPVRGATVVVDLLRSAGDADPYDSDSMKTRADGSAAFKLTVPPHFDAGAVREGTAKVHLRVRAVDRAEQAAESTREVPVSDGPLTIRLVPEADGLAEGIANVLHVAVSDPGGRPVEADVTLSAGGSLLGTATTDARGYALVLTAPLVEVDEIEVRASADGGARTATQTFPFARGATDGFLLARPDAAIVRVGETLTVALHGSENSADVTVEFRHDGRPLDARNVTLTGGTGQVAFQPTTDAIGEIEIAVRMLDAGGRLLQDRRTVVVALGDDLAVAVAADRGEYQPGESGELSLHVTGQDGSGVEAELGVTAVDEAVYLLTAGRVGTEALEEGGAGLDGTESFGGGTTLGDLLAGDRSQADQDLASAILAYGRRAGGALDSHRTNVVAELAMAQEKVYVDGRMLTNRLRRKGRAARRRAIRSGRFVDPWGNPYEVSIQGKPREVLVTSGGVDEVLGTEDDLAFVFRVRPRRRAAGVRLDGFFDDVVGPPVDDVGGVVGAPVFRGPNADAIEAFVATAGVEDSGGIPAAPDVAVRRFFPETLLAVPDLVTDTDGHAVLPFALADNVTTWRVAALASSADGRVGSGTTPLPVRKDMFVDLGLPRSFTHGDRIQVPVVAYNLTSADRDVSVQLHPADWFEATDGVARVISVPAGSAARGTFGIHVLGTGDVALRVDATSDELVDAVEMTAHVVPDARPVSFVRSGQVLDPVTETIHIPATALPGETTMHVHLLPGVLSQTLDGLDALLHEPYGCFEQTTSTTYPNALVLAYLRDTGTLDPEVSERAKRYLTQGIQKLLTFEVDGGGFSLWGGPPASIILSGYALQEFEDIAKVRHVDPALIDRTTAWLVAQQQANGSWAPSTAGVHFGTSTDPLRVTAYIAWILADTNRAPAALERALAFLRTNTTGQSGLYTRVVAANALLAADSGDALGRSLLAQLLTERTQDESGTYWSFGTGTGSVADERGLMSSSGHGADVETTAMMVQALLATGGHADIVTDVLAFLAGARSEYGGWGGTFATVWTLKAFLAALPGASGGGAGTVHVRLNGVDVETVPFDGRDAPRVVDVSAFVVTGDNAVELTATGAAQPYYRISGGYVIPWSEPLPEPEPLAVEVTLDPVRPRAGRSATMTLSVRNERPSGDAEQVTAIVALPPGFSVDEAQLGDLRDAGEFDRFELRGGRLNLYLGRIGNGARRTIEFRVHPTLRGTMMLPHTTVYEYYDPESRGSSSPRRVQIR